MQEPTPEFQATADLSPLSPEPLHSTSAPEVVPVLQDQADAIAAVATMPAAAGSQDAMAEDTIVMSSSDDDGSSLPDDSFDDAYGEDEPQANTSADQIRGADTGADDYARTFDSPSGADEDAQVSDARGDVTEAPETMNISLPPGDTLRDAAPAAAAPSSEAPVPSPPQGAFAARESPTSRPETRLNPQSATTPASQADSLYEDDAGPDIEKLVADLTAPAEESAPTIDNPVAVASAPQASSSSLPEGALATASASPSTLPPKPQPPQRHPSQSHAQPGFRHPTESVQGLPSAVIAPPTPGQPSTYVVSGAPGTSAENIGSLPPPPATALNAPVAITSLTGPPHPDNAPPPLLADRRQQRNQNQNQNEQQQQQQQHNPDYQRLWEQFVADERRYMSEAKWDRFPDGSRIFIGNLSSDRVSKRDVFELFHNYGRLAQISLKSAYGFVQYHTVEDAQAAMEALQGVEIRGRKIHLEFSRAQKKDKNADRARSPDKGGRGGRDGQRGDRAEDGRQGRRGRDDYRPGRNSSPRRNDFQPREENAGRDRGYYDAQGRTRGRSRSPPPQYGRQDPDPYRRRSPSPYGRTKLEPDRLDIPRRYGSQVPDVQLLLLQEVGRDFVSWVERAFTDRGLKTEVMFLNPSFPRDSVIQRQVMEGVHAVVDLDLRAHSYAKIPLQVFDRSAGIDKVRFDVYQDLDPPIAAELVLRAKGQTAQPQYQPPYAGVGQHTQHPYGIAPVTHAPYGSAPPPSAAVPHQQQHQQQPPVSAADIAGMVGQIDNATLQRLLASLQQPQQAAAGGAPAVMGAGGPGQMPPNAWQAQAANAAAGATNSQVDLGALLGNLNGAGGAAPAPPTGQGHVAYGAAYGQAPPAGNTAPGSANTNAQVQNIMAQLARYRQ